MLNRLKFQTGESRHRRTSLLLLGTFLILILVLDGGCAKYNTFFNAKRAFDKAEHVRNEAIRQHQDPPQPKGQQKSDYETAIRKAQKILDDYPGNGLTDDALFLQAKAWHRLESYRMSIRKLDLLFTNFPQSEYMEEALYLQGLNHLLIGSLVKSQEFLDRLAKVFPDSKYQAETRKVVGDNAYAMKDWETALASYQEYLAQKAGVQDPDRIGVKLSQCCWELRRYDDAIPVLDTVIDNTLSTEIAFNARLLKARILTRLQRYDESKALLDLIRPEAEIFRTQGMVTLAEAENLFAQGKGAEATPILENMPTDWNTPEVKARVADLLGHQLMVEGKWEDAKVKFQDALRNKLVLDDQEETRRLSESLNDYLAAEAGLKDAKGERLPRLKLLKANALLFGLDRPATAAQFYLEAAADTAADSSDAARSLFGAVVAYRDYLAQPDSAALFASQLQARFPASPQAFEVSSTKGGRDLLEYLLDRKRQIQRDNLAALSPEELTALETIPSGFDQEAAHTVVHGPGARRRMVYLSRRPNLHYEPPKTIRPLEGSSATGDFHAQEAQAQEKASAAVSDSTEVPQGPAPVKKVPADQEKKPEPKKKSKPKKHKSDNWDLLRGPRP